MVHRSVKRSRAIAALSGVVDRLLPTLDVVVILRLGTTIALRAYPETPKSDRHRSPKSLTHRRVGTAHRHKIQAVG